MEILLSESAVAYTFERVVQRDGLAILDAIKKQHELINSDSDKIAIEATKAVLTRSQEIYRINHDHVTQGLSDKLKEILEDVIDSRE